MSTQPWSQPQRYEIRLEGHLSSWRAQMFEGLEMVQEPGGATVLTGLVIDQAALHGILDRIRDLGVPLLSVERLSADEVSNTGQQTASCVLDPWVVYSSPGNRNEDS